MRRTSLRQRLFIVVAAAVVPLAIMSTVALYAGYQQQRVQAERAGLDIARALSTAVEAELRRTISVLEVLGTSALLDHDDLPSFHERARLARNAQPHWRAILLSDPDGNPLLNSERPYGEATPPIVERDSLDQVLRNRAAAVGYLAKGPQGHYAFPVRVPISRAGKVRYVLSAVLDPQSILDLLQSQRVGGAWVVAIADAKGIRVARTRSMQESIGTPYSPSLVAMMQRGGEEGTGITYSTEGEAVFTAYTRSKDTGWITAVGQPTAQVDAAGRHSFITLGSGVLLSILVGALAAFVMARSISRPMERLRETAMAMGRGERVAAAESEIRVSDVREIHDVALTLATAAREQDHARAEREELLRREQDARAAAEAANRAKDEFLAMLGHELRNPLGAISNAASLLQHEKLAPEAAIRAHGVIARQVGHLTRLTDDLLDAGRALMGKIVLRPQPLDLAAVAAQSLATLKASGRLHGHRIVEDLEPAWVEADSIRLDQIIGNLVVNAVKYTPEAGTIRVSVKREGGEAVLRVADTGIGIEPALAARVFELFVQGDRDLDRSQGGLGIGLTLVRRLAEMHGGSASVASEGPGKGSEFTVRLPLVEAAVQSGTTPDRPAAAPRRNILIIEDNADARETLRTLLTIFGHSVETASDGLAGLEKALALQPEIALVDIGLPGLDGYEIARRIRASRGLRQPLLVAVTGYGTPADRERALAAGFDAHVVKPVDSETLASILATPSPSTAS